MSIWYFLLLSLFPSAHVLDKKRKILFFLIIDFLLYYQNAFAFWFSVFYARTVIYTYTYSFVIPDICTNHFCVYNSDILYCILGTTGPAFFTHPNIIYCSSIALLYSKNTIMFGAWWCVSLTFLLRFSVSLMSAVPFNAIFGFFLSHYTPLIV
jgi:hypothetical protein